VISRAGNQTLLFISTKRAVGKKNNILLSEIEGSAHCADKKEEGGDID